MSGRVVEAGLTLGRVLEQSDGSKQAVDIISEETPFRVWCDLKDVCHVLEIIGDLFSLPPSWVTEQLSQYESTLSLASAIAAAVATTASYPPDEPIV